MLLRKSQKGDEKQSMMYPMMCPRPGDDDEEQRGRRESRGIVTLTLEFIAKINYRKRACLGPTPHKMPEFINMFRRTERIRGCRRAYVMSLGSASK